MILRKLHEYRGRQNKNEKWVGRSRISRNLAKIDENVDGLIFCAFIFNSFHFVYYTVNAIKLETYGKLFIIEIFEKLYRGSFRFSNKQEIHSAGVTWPHAFFCRFLQESEKRIAWKYINVTSLHRFESNLTNFFSLR